MTIYVTYFLLPLLAVLTALFIGKVIQLMLRSPKETLIKPTTPKKITTIIGREKELRRLVRQIMRGQSSAIIGSPRRGKTLMLDYLRDENPEHRAMLYGDKADRLLFSYLDISAFDEKYSSTQFWEYALKPLQDKTLDISSALAEAYKKWPSK